MEKIIMWVKDNLKLVVGAFFILSVIVILFFTQQNSNQSTNFAVDKVQQTKLAKKANPKTIVVDVQGAVNHPGVYHLASNSRIYDAVKAAGGANEQADLRGINQAQKLNDQSQVIVPTTQEVDVATTANAETTTSNTQAVNLNSATLTELQSISGVGPKKAEAIIQYREENGGFEKVEDLANVNGIGEKTLAAIKDQITV